MDVLSDREKVINHKKNVIALILSLAYRDIGGIEEVTQFLKNRLYDADQICEIFEILIRKKIPIKRAFKGVE